MNENLLQSIERKIPVSLSGKTLAGRGWDARIQRSENDPQWNRIAEAIERESWIKIGNGFKIDLRLSREDVKRLIDDLEDNIELYSGQGEEDTRAYVRAWKKDVERMKKEIQDHDNRI